MLGNLHTIMIRLHLDLVLLLVVAGKLGLPMGNAQVYIEGPAVDSVCYGNTVSLTCSYPNVNDMVNGRRKYLSTNSEWAVNGIRLPPDGTTDLNSTTERLDVTITREQFEDSLFYYSCYLILYNGSRDTSSDVEIDPPEHPTPPTLREPITTTPSTVTLEVDHRNTCFENCTFQYEVKVHPAGSHMTISTTTHSTNVFNVSGLSGGTRYRAEIVAVCVEESTIRSDPLNVNFTTRMEDGPTVTSTTPPYNGTDPTSGTNTTANSCVDAAMTTLPTGLIAGIMVVCVVVILLTFLAGCGVGVIGHVVYQKKAKQSTNANDKDKKNTSVSHEVNVESDNIDISMTTNPSYGHLEMRSEYPKPLYGNL